MTAHDCGVVSSVFDNLLTSLDGSGSRVTSNGADDVDFRAASDLVCSFESVRCLLLSCVFQLVGLLFDCSLVFIIRFRDGLNHLLSNLGGSLSSSTLDPSDWVKLLLIIVLSEDLLEGTIEIVFFLKFDCLG
jgi:hypothetical protein